MVAEKIKARATAQQIEAIKSGQNERLVGDELVPNLYLVVSPKGRKTWRWTARIASTGRAPKIPLGAWPAYGLAEAREWARRLNEQRERGVDPSQAMRDAEAAVEAAQKALEADQARSAELSVRKVHARYIAHKRRVREAVKSLPEKERLAKANIFPVVIDGIELGDKPVSGVTKADVREVVRRVQERDAPGAANRVLAEMKAFLGWCDGEDLIAHNPATALKKTKEEGERRHLPLHELALVWRAAGTLVEDERDAFRLLILTGCRRTESICARSSEYRDGVWTIPRTRAKTRQPCMLPLSPVGRRIFESRSKRDCLFVENPRPDSMKRAIARLYRAVEEVNGSALEKWEIHSIRHGVRTALTGKRITSKDIAERIINHSLGGIDKRYDHDLYLEEKLEAMQAWEAMILAEVDRQTGANVVPLAA